jgi:hypothetical protein
MKKYILLSLGLVFSASLSAQVLPKVSSNDLKKEATKMVSEENPDMESQIKSALMKDEGLQKDTINYLKSNPETTKSLIGLVKDNEGSYEGIMKSILGDKELTSMAVDYISKNPKLLRKAMKLIKM